MALEGDLSSANLCLGFQLMLVEQKRKETPPLETGRSFFRKLMREGSG